MREPKGRIVEYIYLLVSPGMMTSTRWPPYLPVPGCGPWDPKAADPSSNMNSFKPDAKNKTSIMKLPGRP